MSDTNECSLFNCKHLMQEDNYRFTFGQVLLMNHSDIETKNKRVRLMCIFHYPQIKRFKLQQTVLSTQDWCKLTHNHAPHTPNAFIFQ